MSKLVVFPNDPIYKYYEKGEIKPRYYNPGNLFDEVHLITLCRRDIEPEKVQALAGQGRLFIHPIGGGNALSLFNLLTRADALVRDIAPDAIRGHGVLIGGLLAVRTGKRNGVPVILSVHCNPDEDFAEWLKRKWMPWRPKLLGQYLWYRLFQAHILSNADVVICAYDFVRRYVLRHGTRDPYLIYNRVDTNRFRPLKRTKQNPRPVVLSVNQQIEVKNPEVLLHAVKDSGMDLLLIGNGVLQPHLKSVAKSLNLHDSVTFLNAVPHSEIHQYYQRADIFANPMLCGGISMGTMEAMACGLPVIHARPLWEDTPEVLGSQGLIVESTPQAFHAGLSTLFSDDGMRKHLGDLGRSRILQMNGEKMERRELAMYKNVLH